MAKLIEHNRHNTTITVDNHEFRVLKAYAAQNNKSLHAVCSKVLSTFARKLDESGSVDMSLADVKNDKRGRPRAVPLEVENELRTLLAQMRGADLRAKKLIAIRNSEMDSIMRLPGMSTKRYDELQVQVTQALRERDQLRQTIGPRIEELQSKVTEAKMIAAAKRSKP